MCSDTRHKRPTVSLSFPRNPWGRTPNTSEERAHSHARIPTCFAFFPTKIGGEERKASRHEQLIFLSFMTENVQQNVTYTADIYYYITTKFEYAKRDFHISVCGGAVFTLVLRVHKWITRLKKLRLELRSKMTRK